MCYLSCFLLGVVAGAGIGTLMAVRTIREIEYEEKSDALNKLEEILKVRKWN